MRVVPMISRTAMMEENAHVMPMIPRIATVENNVEAMPMILILWRIMRK